MWNAHENSYEQIGSDKTAAFTIELITSGIGLRIPLSGGATRFLYHEKVELGKNQLVSRNHWKSKRDRSDLVQS